MAVAAPARVFAAGVLTFALASVPLFSTVLPPLTDYPNHLARFSLLAAGGNEFYAVRWTPLPNLAGDLVVPLLARIMPLALAGKLFLAAIFALTLTGAVWLNRLADGAWRLWPLLTVAFLYNRPFLWGFVNYLFGLGVALCGAALWLAMERGAAAVRVAAASIVATLCFFAHIAAFVIYALMILGLEVVPALSELRALQWRALARRAAAGAAQFAVPAAIVIGWWHPAGQGHTAYSHFWRKVDLLFTVFDNYSRPFDIACFALLIVLLGALAWRRQLRIAPRLAPMLGLVAAAYLASPTQMMTGADLDHRIAVALFVLLVAATAPRFASRRTAMLVAGATAMVLALRLAVVEGTWLRADRAYRADLAAIDALPRGVKLAVAFPAEALHAAAIPEIHVPTLAVWRRGGFVPTLFAYPTQQPIALRPPYDRYAAMAQPTQLWAAFVTGEGGQQAAAWRALAAWDAIVFVDRRPISVPPHPCLQPLRLQPTFKVFLLRHGDQCLAPYLPPLPSAGRAAARRECSASAPPAAAPGIARQRACASRPADAPAGSPRDRACRR